MIEGKPKRKITREVWEDVAQYACGEPDMRRLLYPIPIRENGER
jgi:hypothetical protein